MLTFIIVISVIVAVVYYRRKYQQKINAVVQAFAATQGLQYVASVPVASIIPVNDIFLGRLAIVDVLTDSSGAITCFVDITIQEGKYSERITLLTTKHTVASQASFTLMPPDSNYFRTDGMKPLKFESDDLNNIFRVVVKPGDEVGALEILGPDTMLWLAQQAPNVTIVARPGALYVALISTVNFNADTATASLGAQYTIINAVTDYIMAHSAR